MQPQMVSREIEIYDHYGAVMPMSPYALTVPAAPAAVAAAAAQYPPYYSDPRQLDQYAVNGYTEEEEEEEEEEEDEEEEETA